MEDKVVEKCYCSLLSAHRNIPVSAWDDFDTNKKGSQKEAAGVKGKKQWGTTKSRYGYETLDDKYKFVHHEDTRRYIEDYTDMFSIANRAHKKSFRPNAYRVMKIGPSPTIRLPVKDSRHLYKLAPDATNEADDSPRMSQERKDPDDERREEQITLDTRPIITPLSNPNQNNGEQSNHPYMEKEMAEAMSHMKSAPGLGSEYTIDAAKDSVIDEYEDYEDQSTEAGPKIPLLKQLNTFFLSRNGRKRTNYTPVQSKPQTSSGLVFPSIHHSNSAPTERSSQELSDMTPASIINYRVPTENLPYRPRTQHQQIMIQGQVDSKHPMVKSMLERQKTQLLPLKMRAMMNSSMSTNSGELIAHNSNKQTSNQKRFNALNLKHQPSPPSAGSDRGLPKSHVLKARNIVKAQSHNDLTIDNRKQTNGAFKSQSVTDMRTDIDCDSGSTSSQSRTDQKKIISDILLNYGTRSLHPYLNSMESSYSTAKRFSKAELVDYSSILENQYQH